MPETTRPSEPSGDSPPQATVPPSPGATPYRLIEEAASLLEAAFDSLADKARLEAFRLGQDLRRVVRRTVVAALSAVVGLVGLAFFSVGAALALSASIGSPGTGFLLVGGFYLAIGGLTILILWWSRRRQGDDGQPRS